MLTKKILILLITKINKSKTDIFSISNLTYYTVKIDDEMVVTYIYLNIQTLGCNI